MNTNDQKVMFSSAKQDWGTPQDFFDDVDAEFHFTLDAAADHENTKCVMWFTEEQDALKQRWFGRVWVNPPYGRGITGKWVRRAYEQIYGRTDDDRPSIIVMLLPARTDTSYFHDYIYHQPNVEVRFIRGRLKFVGAKDPAPFPSMLVIMRRADDAA